MAASGGGGGGNKTLFIGNLAYNVTTQELQELVEEIGPVKSCFLVTDRLRNGQRKASSTHTHTHVLQLHPRPALPRSAAPGQSAGGRRSSH